MLEKELHIELESAVGGAGAQSYVVRAEPEACILASTMPPTIPRPALSEAQRLIALAPVQEATCTGPTFLARLQCWFEADERLP
jgi:hypothetical protein